MPNHTWLGPLPTQFLATQRPSTHFSFFFFSHFLHPPTRPLWEGKGGSRAGRPLGRRRGGEPQDREREGRKEREGGKKGPSHSPLDRESRKAAVSRGGFLEKDTNLLFLLKGGGGASLHKGEEEEEEEEAEVADGGGGGDGEEVVVVALVVVVAVAGGGGSAGDGGKPHSR